MKHNSKYLILVKQVSVCDGISSTSEHLRNHFPMVPTLVFSEPLEGGVAGARHWRDPTLHISFPESGIVLFLLTQRKVPTAHFLSCAFPLFRNLLL